VGTLASDYGRLVGAFHGSSGRPCGQKKSLKFAGNPLLNNNFYIVVKIGTYAAAHPVCG
jgi:hypothetical protein